MAAMQLFIKEQTFPVNTAEKFNNYLDPDLFPFFKQTYPSHTSAVPLDASLQLNALWAMLSAAQIAEDNRKTNTRKLAVESASI
jgi:hypothetical protein